MHSRKLNQRRRAAVNTLLRACIDKLSIMDATKTTQIFKWKWINKIVCTMHHNTGIECFCLKFHEMAIKSEMCCVLSYSFLPSFFSIRTMCKGKLVIHCVELVLASASASALAGALAPSSSTELSPTCSDLMSLMSSFISTTSRSALAACCLHAVPRTSR